SASNWQNPVTLAIPATWVSGVYVVKLVSSAGLMRYTEFVVRNDASQAPILFQSSVLTYQAGNAWGGRSLDGNGAANTTADRSFAVSFDRPEAENAGLSDFTTYEYNLLSWLERQGYNVTYTTDIDTDLNGQSLLQHRLFLAAGHDEYWSSGMWTSITQARDAGVSLAFFGANDAYWHVRLQSSSLGADRVVVCYKDAGLDPLSGNEPTSATTLWQNAPLNQPSQALLGAMFSGLVAGPAPLILSPGAAPFLQGTALHEGSVLQGLVGAELSTTSAGGDTGGFDSVFPNLGTPSALTILASSPVKVQPNGNDNPNPNGAALPTATATLYTAPGGARVFDAGTYWWALGLQNMHADASVPAGSYSSPDFQRFTSNLLSYLLQAHASPSN
ncbi:MAG TPA: N,N-dimethylformamidase beta subunit family domain-containing protein, partial [Ktedonobacteraceae bacterium]